MLVNPGVGALEALMTYMTLSTTQGKSQLSDLSCNYNLDIIRF